MTQAKPEDLVQRVHDELHDHNTFDGNFDAEPLELLLQFLKCPRDGIRALLHDLKLYQFNPAYDIAIYEVALSLERQISVDPVWSALVQDTMKLSELAPDRNLFAPLVKFLKTMPQIKVESDA